MLEFSTTKENQKILDVLFNQENTEPVCLTDANGRNLKLEQVFAIKMEEQAYCILAPINKVEGLEDGVALVFTPVGEALRLETDRETVAKVFGAYYEALRLSAQVTKSTDVA